MRQSCRTGDNHVAQKYRIFYVTQEHVTTQNTKTLFHLSPKNPICRLQKQKLRSCDTQLSHGRHKTFAQKHRMYVRQEDIAAQQTKTLFLGDKTCPPCDNIVALKHRNALRATAVHRTCDTIVTQKLSLY